MSYGCPTGPRTSGCRARELGPQQQRSQSLATEAERSGVRRYWSFLSHTLSIPLLHLCVCVYLHSISIWQTTFRTRVKREQNGVPMGVLLVEVLRAEQE